MQRAFADTVRIGPTQVSLDIRQAGRQWQETLEAVMKILVELRDTGQSRSGT
jgi:hypothetical protein